VKPNDLPASILTLARAGATSRAWAAFGDAGLGDVADDPRVLTLKGRLLKDQARRAQGDARGRLFLRSAQAYADAAALRPDSYPLINAATMSLFAGESSHMERLAREVLQLQQTSNGGGETPYWHEATKAEALLLLGKAEEAKTALKAAIAAGPTAWEDRAVTLRQFREILACRDEGTAWLAAFAPPKSLYFRGLIGLAPDDTVAANKIRDAIRQSDAGFGYGALAAGADILIADALIESGAELHLVLPILPSTFREQSVEQFGAEWLPRFDALFEQAVSVTLAGSGDRLTDAAITHASHIAKGMAIDNAARLESVALGLAVDENAAPEVSDGGDLQVRLPRSAVMGSGPPLEEGRRLISMITDRPIPASALWTEVESGFHLAMLESRAQAHELAIRVRQADPYARAAIGIVVDTDIDGHPAQLLRIAQAGSEGTILASTETTMAMKSAFPGLWIEPLGELPDAAGAVGLYAIDLG
jgi:tetratricopeptide (TPR) repeat protein